MYDSYAKWIHSWRDLPLLLNQWNSVVRWETKATKPFLRTREFLWQEGHTVHATKEEADAEVMLILDFYRQVAEDYLAIPVLLGKKSDGEKFAGALYTTTIEALMPDGKALQAGTSHNLGQHFAKAFGIKFKDKDEKDALPWQCSWGMSTRLIGAMIMAHGDDKGLVIPPKVAPLKVVIVPISYSDEKEAKKVTDYCAKVRKELEHAGLSVFVDERDDKKPGWKFSEWELKGVPVRLEVGLKDIEKDAVMAVRRDNGKKESLALKGLPASIEALLDDIQNSLFAKSKKFLDDHVHDAADFEHFKKTLEEHKGFVRMSWCDRRECEDEIKEKTTATVRIIPFEHAKPTQAKCAHCGNPAKTMAYFAKSY
jgi:prolyl-tRNA synthetase